MDTDTSPSNDGRTDFRPVEMIHLFRIHAQDGFEEHQPEYPQKRQSVLKHLPPPPQRDYPSFLLPFRRQILEPWLVEINGLTVIGRDELYPRLSSAGPITAVFQTIGAPGLLVRTQSLFTFGAPAALYPGCRMAS